MKGFGDRPALMKQQIGWKLFIPFVCFRTETVKQNLGKNHNLWRKRVKSHWKYVKKSGKYRNLA